MERQLKERLIGAAVLVAIAVIMVPEMFSGPRSHAVAVTDSASASSGQIQTYQIELQSAHSSEVAPELAVQEPAPRPRDEVATAGEGNGIESSSDNSSSVSSASSLSAASTSRVTAASSVAKPAAKPKPEPIAEAPNKPAPKPAEVAKPVDGEWVVQVGSFGTEDKARQIVAKLKGQGHAAYLGKVAVGGKTLYRVRVGGMASRAAAETALKKINNTYPGASVVPANR